MDLDRYYRSITTELIAVKDRVENVIDAGMREELVPYPPLELLIAPDRSEGNA